jgi:3-hydroxyisobutyrate dehydrogenase and related beta-hydroxyacid dehydrogenases
MYDTLPMNIQRIGFIGLGFMGHGMAANLLRKGFPLSVKVNRDRSRLQDILAAGARECATNAEVARASDVVILCVAGSPQVEDIVFGEAGIASAAREGLIVIDTTTAEPGSTARIREALAAKGTAFVDAPLGRTPKEAEEGRLNAIVAPTTRPSRR